MKHILTFIFLFSTLTIYACTCLTKTLSQRFDQAAFIGVVKLLNHSTEVRDSTRWFVFEIESLEIYRGEKPKLLYSVDDGCSFYGNNNTQWLVFAHKDQSGKLLTSYCSGNLEFEPKLDSVKYPQLGDKLTDKLDTKLQILELLKINNINNLNSNTPLDCSSGITADNSLKGFIETHKYAIYSVKIGKNHMIKKVKTLRDFKNRKLSRRLVKFINNCKFNLTPKSAHLLEKDLSIILIFYYYAAEDNHQSFVSFQDL